MRKMIFGALLLACAALPASADEATDLRVADGTGAWYISPLAQYTFLDKDRLSKDHVGYDIAGGMNFAPNWAAEINGSIGSFKIPNSGASQQLDAYSLDVLYKFLPESIFRPYLVAGGGAIHGLEHQFKIEAELQLANDDDRRLAFRNGEEIAAADLAFHGEAEAFEERLDRQIERGLQDRSPSVPRLARAFSAKVE